MDTNSLPQSNNSYEPEIYRLLKLGAFANSPIVPVDTGAAMEINSKADSQPLRQALGNAASKAAALVGPYKGILVYPAVFAGSFLIFYGTMNFPSLTATVSGYFQKPQDQQQLGQDLPAYNQWISGYFYQVSNRDLLSPNNDYDHDGLTNYDEFIMRTNPTVADSDNDGTSDGVEVLNDSNPWGAGAMTDAQKKTLSKIDLNMVSERISYGVSENKGNNTTNTDANNFDLTHPGLISIPKLNISAPLIFSPDPSTFDNDLEHGVIHYPGTALPGQTGTMYVSGHSSDYIWKHDKFATIFTKINYLKPGDDVFVTVYGKDGKTYNYRYRVTGQKVYSPDDQTQFIDNTSAKLNLSTCWPIGTAQNRMVITAELSSL